jgi:hypothetical protein
MNPDAQETAKRAELKAGLEEIAGRKLNMTDEQLLSGFWPVASSTYLAKHDADDDAWITSERIAFPPPISMDSALLDTGGLSVTGSGGQIVFRLGNPSGGYQRRGFNTYNEPVNLVATPQGTSPLFMTMSHKFVYDEIYHLNYDVEITACSWKPDGTAAANVHFYWRCRVPTVETIFNVSERMGSAPTAR